MLTLCFAHTVLGHLAIGEEDGAIVSVFFEHVKKPPVYEEGTSPLLKQAKRELEEYLAGTRRSFTLPLSPRGTDFLRSAWSLLTEIPYGETRSYREQAVLLGRPNAARGVGLANSRNPIPILIPCHRLVGSNGSLTGFRGGLVMKQWLLDLEAGRNPNTQALNESLVRQRKATQGQGEAL